MAGTSEDAAGFHSEAGFRSGLRIWLALPLCNGKGCGFGAGHRSVGENAGSGPKINQPAGVEYLRCALEDYAYPAETYDIVISSLTLHYIEDLSALFRKVAQTLRTGGNLSFRWSIRSLPRKAVSSGLIRLLPVIRYGRLPGISWTAAGIRFFGRAGREIPSFADNDRAGFVKHWF